MHIPIDALGTYIQKPHALDVFSLNPRGLALQCLYDRLGYCAGIVLYANAPGEQGVDTVIYDLRIESHVPVRDFLLAFAAAALSATNTLHYYRLRGGRRTAGTRVIGARVRRLMASPARDTGYAAAIDVARLQDHRKEERKREAGSEAEVGQLYLAFVAAQLHRLMPVAALAEKAAALIALRQFQTFFDDGGRPLGVISWAWLEREVVDGALPLAALHPCRWTEGDQLCICDVHGVPAAARQMHAFIESTLGAGRSGAWIYPAHREHRREACRPYGEHALAERLNAGLSPENRMPLAQ